MLGTMEWQAVKHRTNTYGSRQEDKGGNVKSTQTKRRTCGQTELPTYWGQLEGQTTYNGQQKDRDIEAERQRRRWSQTDSLGQGRKRRQRQVPEREVRADADVYRQKKWWERQADRNGRQTAAVRDRHTRRDRLTNTDSHKSGRDGQKQRGRLTDGRKDWERHTNCSHEWGLSGSP